MDHSKLSKDRRGWDALTGIICLVNDGYYCIINYNCGQKGEMSVFCVIYTLMYCLASSIFCFSFNGKNGWMVFFLLLCLSKFSCFCGNLGLSWPDILTQEGLIITDYHYVICLVHLFFLNNFSNYVCLNQHSS